MSSFPGWVEDGDNLVMEVTIGEKMAITLASVRPDGLSNYEVWLGEGVRAAEHGRFMSQAKAVKVAEEKVSAYLRKLD